MQFGYPPPNNKLLGINWLYFYNMKRFVLFVFLCVVASNIANAQSDGFFKSYNDNYENRDAGVSVNDEGGISNYGIGETVPLGGGLLILLGAGVGYAVARRRRSSKKFTSVLLACVMLLTFTNCKKKIETVSNNTAESVFITLNLGDGSKVDVMPGFEDPETHEIYAKVTFEKDDTIYVGNNGKYCGKLVYDDVEHRFSGTITPTSEDDYLHFYFMGNKKPSVALESNATTTFSVNITDQTEKYPIISYAHSTQVYNSDIKTYRAKLRNYCAIVKFNITNDNIPKSNAVSITANNNIVTVNFAANNYAELSTGEPYAFSKYGEGDITLHAVDGNERWAILVPQPKVNYAQASATGCFSVSSITIPQITANEYRPSGINVALVQPLPGAFCVDKDFNQVFFAPGNLQYTRESLSADWSTGQWSFKANQYDIDSECNDAGTNYANLTVISHFGWGASGWDNTANDPLALNYQPQSTSNVEYSDATNPHHYGPSNVGGASQHIAGTNWDWGVYHSEGGDGATITNGGGHSWRLPTNSDMKFILGPNISVAPSFGYNTRRSATVNGVPNARFAKAYLFGTVHGCIIFPDGYVHPDGVPGPDYINVMDVAAAWDANQYTLEQWTMMQEAGAVFLPSGGCHEIGKGGVVKIQDTSLHCYYWTSTADANNNPKNAKNVRISQGSMVPDSNTSRTRGNCVRLVRTATAKEQ